MIDSSSPGEPVRVWRSAAAYTLELDRPQAFNSLDPETVRLMRHQLREAAQDEGCRLVILCGAGEKGFCAGGDIKYMARRMQEQRLGEVLDFLAAEYEMDLTVHRFPKPVVVLAHGVTMGGGIGISAGADAVVATESTRMAMPESRIGFFPDVGATGWLFDKCPPGYPEFLGLTGYEVRGRECVRLGLASHLVPQQDLGALRDRLQSLDPDSLPQDPLQLRNSLYALLDRFSSRHLPQNPELDAWVRDYFAGQHSVQAVRDSLSSCSRKQELCGFVFSEFGSRSPTALALTLLLLRRNERRSLEEVFAADLKAARFMLQHRDFLEGVRARLLDKDNEPRWDPADLEAVDLEGLDLE